MAFLDETGLATLWELTLGKIAPKVDLEIVSYTGTGTAGSSNPTSVTFSKAPSVIIMLGFKYNDRWYSPFEADYDNFIMLPTDVITTTYTRGMGLGYERNYYIYGSKSSDGKTFSWYSYDSAKGDGTAAEQYNTTGYVYYVLGLSTGSTSSSGSSSSGSTDSGSSDSGDTVTFTIDGSAKTVDSGTTWSEYIASLSSTKLSVDSSGYVRYEDEFYVHHPDSGAVKGTDVILAADYEVSY